MPGCNYVTIRTSSEETACIRIAPCVQPAVEDGELSVATSDDQQDVLEAFGDVYFGTDYIYAIFPYIVKRPVCTAFLYKIKGELVAFASTKLVDGGQTLVIQAARVKFEYQNRGVFSRFRLLIFNQFSDRTLYPKLHNRMVTTALIKTIEYKLWKYGWEKVCLKLNTWIAFRASSLSNLKMQKAPSRQVIALTQNDLQQLFSSDSSTWLHLFPQKRIVIAWGPYSVMAENVCIILNGKLDTVFYGTTASESSTQPQGSAAKFSLLSAGSYHACEVGICYYVDIFGTTDSRKEYEDHVNNHLHRLRDKVTKGFPGTVLFQVFAHERLKKIVSNATKKLTTVRIVKGDCACPGKLQLWETAFIPNEANVS